MKNIILKHAFCIASISALMLGSGAAQSKDNLTIAVPSFLTGGAAGTKTLTVDVYETGFNLGNLGSGAANAVLVFLILVFVAIFIIKFSPKE